MKPFVLVLMLFSLASAQSSPSDLEEQACRAKEKPKDVSKCLDKLAKQRRKEEVKLMKERWRAEAARPITSSFRATKSDVQGSLTAEMVKYGYAIHSETPHQISFWKDEPAPFNFLSSLLLGNYADAAYRRLVFFTISPAGEDVNVTPLVELWVQNHWGALTKYNVTNAGQSRIDLRSLFDRVRMQLEGAPSDSAATKLTNAPGSPEMDGPLVRDATPGARVLVTALPVGFTASYESSAGTYKKTLENDLDLRTFLLAEELIGRDGFQFALARLRTVSIWIGFPKSAWPPEKLKLLGFTEVPRTTATQ